MNVINNRALTLGVDIGGTNTVFRIVDAEGNILSRGCMPTKGHPYFADFISSYRRPWRYARNS